MLKIREATLDDLDSVYELIIAIAQHHDQEKHVVTDKAELKKSGFSESPKFGVLLAELEGNIAGYASYTMNYSIWSGNPYMSLDDLFVWDTYRGLGIGEALMNEARRVCKVKGYPYIKWEVEQDNLQAIKFYERIGAELSVKGVCRWQTEK